MSLSVDIRLRAGTFWLDVAFKTDARDVVILGSSGAGKTLILRAIAGLQKPIDGNIRLQATQLFDSESRIDLPVRRRNIGYLFQDYALFPHLTVEQNIEFGVTRQTKAESSRSLSQMIDMMQLGTLRGRQPDGLSGGERQRVAFARALAPHPDLLLLDEPFSALDAPSRELLIEEFIELRKNIDAPCVLVTHDIAEAYALADHLVVVGNGHVLQSGSKAEVFHRPHTPEVARLVGVHNIFRNVRDGKPVLVGVRAGDIVLESDNKPNATMRQVVDRGVHLLGWLITDHGERVVAELERSHSFDFIPGSRWRINAREGTELVWPVSPDA